jgi:putative endonuclease
LIVSTAGWHVYVVRCADASLYTGIAKDVPARIAMHNSGKGARYTRGRLPVVLVYAEPARDRASAQRREAEIKRLSTVRKRRLAGRGFCRFPDPL